MSDLEDEATRIERQEKFGMEPVIDRSAYMLTLCLLVGVAFFTGLALGWLIWR